MFTSIWKRHVISGFLKTVLLTGTICLLAPLNSFAQTSDAESEAPATTSEDAPEDEVIVTGTHITGYHEGMDAFFRGDFEMAEIEFENEFNSLRRFTSARENAAFDAEVAADRAQAEGAAGGNEGSSVNGPGSSAPIASTGAALSTTPSLSVNFSNRRNEGQTVLTDGETTYEDFAFSRYMAGLSEIKLGKYVEAKASLKSSLFYDENNYDAQMRLGLLYLMENDFEKAADHLEKLDKLRRKCAKRDCGDQKEIRDATLILAKEINKSVASN